MLAAVLEQDRDSVHVGGAQQPESKFVRAHFASGVIVWAETGGEHGSYLRYVILTPWDSVHFGSGLHFVKLPELECDVTRERFDQVWRVAELHGSTAESDALPPLERN